MTSQLSLLSIGYSQSALGTVEAGPTARPWEPFKRIPIRLFGTNKTIEGKEGKAYSNLRIVTRNHRADKPPLAFTTTRRELERKIRTLFRNSSLLSL